MADLSLIPEAAWSEARRRAEVIRPLAARDHRPRHMVQAAAATLGLSERQTYTLLRRCREAGGELTALVPGRSSGGRDRPRTVPASEATLRRVVQEVYLTPQKPTAAEVARTVAGRCRAEKLRPPSSSTVRRRLRALPIADRRKRGEDHSETRPVHGHAPSNPVPAGPGAGRPHANGPDPGGPSRPRADRPALAHDRHRRPQPLHRGLSRDAGCPVGRIGRAVPDARRHGQGTLACAAGGGGGLAGARQAAPGRRGQRGRIPLRGVRARLRATRHRHRLAPAGSAAVRRRGRAG